MGEVDYLRQAEEALEKSIRGGEEMARLRKEYEELEKKKQALKEKFGWGKK